MVAAVAVAERRRVKMNLDNQRPLGRIVIILT